MKKSKRFMSLNNGFTLLEVLIALFCISFCTLLLMQLVQLLMSFPADSFDHDDTLAIHQVRVLLTESDHIRLQNQQIVFTYRSQEYYLLYHHKRLVKEPGYEIFLKDIENGEFYEKEGCIYAGWQRKKSKEALLACQ